ncbi:MAG: hypothetical protein ACYDHN_08840 [Solirubrobacteraceae bacterium]
MAVAVCVGGCGGSGSKAQSKGAFPLANAVCGKLNIDLASNIPSIGSATVIARIAPQNAELEHAALKVLAKLRPPTRIAGNWQKILAYRHTLADQLEALGKAEKSSDQAHAKQLIASKLRVHKELLTLATETEIPECARTG